jgi:hypothetical protein
MPSESNTRSAKSRYKTNPNNIRNHAWGLEDTVALCYDLPDLFGSRAFSLLVCSFTQGYDLTLPKEFFSGERNVFPILYSRG